MISLAVGVGSGLLLDYFKTKKPRLEYQVVTNSVFAGPVENIAILSIEVVNAGAKELEDLTFLIRWEDAELKESKVLGLPPGKYIAKPAKASFLVEAPYINPTETIRVDLLLTLSGQNLESPDIEVRARGIVGTEKELDARQKKTGLFSSIPSVVAALLTALLIVALLRDGLFGRSFLAAGSSHSDDQRDVAAYVLDINGLHEEATKLRALTRKISYWSIADELTQGFLQEGDESKLTRLAQALEQLMDYATIAETSCFLVNYNLARLFLKLGEKDKAKQKLADAYRENHKVIEKRIALVPELASLGVSKKSKG